MYVLYPDGILAASDDSWEANLPDPPAASGEDMAPQLPAVEGAGDSEVVHGTHK